MSTFLVSLTWQQGLPSNDDCRVFSMVDEEINELEQRFHLPYFDWGTLACLVGVMHRCKDICGEMPKALLHIAADCSAFFTGFRR